MRALPLILIGTLFLTGCSGNDVKQAAGNMGQGILVSALYHFSDRKERDQETCREANRGIPDPNCERKRLQAFTRHKADREEAKAREIRIERQDKAEEFRDALAEVRSTPNCIDDGVGCNEQKSDEVSVVQLPPDEKPVTVRDPYDFTSELEELLAR